MGSYSEAVMVSRMMQNWRDHPPSSYSLKIHNFSQLENSSAFTDFKYQSRLFSSGGYNWRLIVYPKGNSKDYGSGFISMYVELDSTSLITPSNEVFAELRFYVYNKEQNKYFTIQDVEVKRFNALRMVWGLKQVIPCDTLKNPENGYVFEEDECEFGVDVIVVPLPPPPTNWEIISFNEKLSEPKVFWKIDKFFELNELYTSKDISVGGKDWVLKLFPKGFTATDDGKWLSVFLYLANTETPKAEEKTFTQAMKHWYTESSNGSGWINILTLDEIGKIYLDEEGALKLEIEFEVVSTTTYSSVN